jgi:hypothetical protein
MKLRPVTYQLNAKDIDLFVAGNNPAVKNKIEQTDYSAPTAIQQTGFIA